MPVPRLIPLFLTGPLIAVSITDPVSGATVTDSSPTISWSFAPGTQQSYRVRLYLEATQQTLVYDSGSVISVVKEHTVPDGAVQSSTTYFVYVTIETTTSILGESEVVEFSTSFAPSVEIDDAVAHTEGDDCDAASRIGALPSVVISWGQVTPSGSETFVRYSIWRRARHHPRHPDADSAWERIGSVTTVSTVTFRDYCASAYIVYEYAVTWTATATAGDQRSSSRQAIPPNVRLQFDRVYVHAIDDPTRFAIWSPDVVDVESGQDVTLQNIWGRNAPTPLVGEFAAHLVRLNALPELHRGDLWRQTHGMQQLQRTAGSTLCCRLGYAGERYFGVVTAPRRSDGQRQSTTSLEFAETHYEEAVT